LHLQRCSGYLQHHLLIAISFGEANPTYSLSRTAI
jgi:hypothetical protein